MSKGDVRILKRRKAPDAKKVRERVAKFCAEDEFCAPEGVQLLNPGFFTLERMRQQNVTKARAKRRGKAKGK